jgi:hypothetical protein
MGDDMIRADSPDPRDITQRPRPTEAGRRPMDEVDNLPKLGSLAQTARNKHLKQARTTLLIVGILMGIAQVVMYFMEIGEVQKAGPQVNQEAAQLFLLLFHGCAIAVALAFIVAAFFVERYPVPITVSALVLFLLVQAIFALADPMNLVRGIILKIIVIVALAKALQAGIAAQREQREVEAAAEYGGR